MKQKSVAKKTRKVGSGATAANERATKYGIYASAAAIAKELALVPELAASTGLDNELLALRLLLVRHLAAERDDFESDVGGEHEPKGRDLSRYPIETIENADGPHGPSRRTTRQRSPILERILTIVKAIGRLEKTKSEIVVMEISDDFRQRVAARLRDGDADGAGYGSDATAAACSLLNADTDAFVAAAFEATPAFFGPVPPPNYETQEEAATRSNAENGTEPVYRPEKEHKNDHRDPDPPESASAGFRRELARRTAKP